MCGTYAYTQINLNNGNPNPNHLIGTLRSRSDPKFDIETNYFGSDSQFGVTVSGGKPFKQLRWKLNLTYVTPSRRRACGCRECLWNQSEQSAHILSEHGNSSNHRLDQFPVFFHNS